MEDDEFDLGLTESDILAGIEELDDGGLELEFENPELVNPLDTVETDHYANLVEYLDAETHNELSSKILEDFENDKQSRGDWEQVVVDGLQNLGLEQEETDEPFEGACTATHPVILENAVKFQAQASNELLPANGPAKVKILGHSTPEKEKIAKRVKHHLNYQLTEVVTEYTPETERMLFFVALFGNGFKKNFFDFKLNRPRSENIGIDRVVVNNMASDLQSADRISIIDYKSKKQLWDCFDTEEFIKPDDLPSPYLPNFSDTEEKIREIQGIGGSDEGYTLIEQHCYLQLDEKKWEIDEDASFKPYIAVIEQTSGKILSLRRNWAAWDANKKRLEWLSHYYYVPGLGFYGIGLVHLLGNLNQSLTLALRSLVDAGQFANMQGGLVDSKLRIKQGDEPIAPGEWRQVEGVGMGDLEKALYAIPYKEPSQTLFAMLQYLDNRSQRFADSTENVVAEGSSQENPVGTTLALLEASAKFFSALHKRLYFAQKSELKTIARINYEFLDDVYPYSIEGDDEAVFKSDYDPLTIDICPVADPNEPSQIHRVSKATTILQSALQAPQIHDLREAYFALYTALGIDNIDKILPLPEEAKEQDPISDLMSVTQGTPIKAYNGQDHDSHVIIKSSWLQDPQNGGNPVFAQFRPAVEANIQEHMMLKYQTQLQALTQQGLPVAQAAQRLARLNQIAQQEEQQGTPDMIIAQAEAKKADVAVMKEQREQQEQQLDKGLELVELGIKAEEAANSAARANRKMDLEQIKLGTDLIKEGIPQVYEE